MGSQYSSQQLIVNEVLAFIQNAIDTMGEDSIVQICQSNFNKAEIRSGKALLFKILGKADEMTSRRREGGAKSLQDIIALIKKTDPDHMPTFVAKELHKLPTVKLDDADDTRLLEDITSLNVRLAEVESKLEAADSTIYELRAQVLLLRNSAVVCSSSDTTNVSTCCRARNASSSSYESSHRDASPAASTASDRPLPIARSTAPPETPNVYKSIPQHEDAAVTAAVITVDAASRPPGPQPEQAVKKGKKAKKDSKTVQPDPRRQNAGSDYVDGFTKVEKKETTKPLYVSRLPTSTSTEKIVEYIRVKTKLTLKVERLEAQQNVNYNSFVVSVPAEHLSTFIKEDFWPSGIICRQFRSRRRR